MLRSCLFLSIFLVTSATAFTGDFELRATDGLNWYRGNMHTHSLWSDGDDYPEMIAAWYKEQDYNFLVFTDHNVLLQGERWTNVAKNKGGQKAFDKLKSRFPDWIESRETDDATEVKLRTFDEVFQRLAVPNQFLLIQGEEITDRFQNRPIHLCATNTRELLPPLHGESVLEVMQRNIDAAISRRERTGVRTLVHLNHPNFGYGVTAEDLMKVIGENFFEVYNGHPGVNDSGDETHASTERMWDIINTMRTSQLDLPIMYGLATDDGHNYHQSTPGKAAQPGRGWVMVLSDKLTPESLVESLEAGRFYSSSGVYLSRIAVIGNQFIVEIDAENGVDYQIEFIGTRRGYSRDTEPAVSDPEKAAQITRVYSDEVGQVLQSTAGTTATYKFVGDELYVRATVTSSRRHPNPSEPNDLEKAWVQPVSRQRQQN